MYPYFSTENPHQQLNETSKIVSHIDLWVTMMCPHGGPSDQWFQTFKLNKAETRKCLLLKFQYHQEAGVWFRNGEQVHASKLQTYAMSTVHVVRSVRESKGKKKERKENVCKHSQSFRKKKGRRGGRLQQKLGIFPCAEF